MTCKTNEQVGRVVEVDDLNKAVKNLSMIEKYHEEQRNRMAYKPPVAEVPKALATQVGGDHYKTMKIQPVEYIHRNAIGYMEGNVIKYVSRWRGKNGLQDLKKARHYLDLLIEMESGGETK